MKTSNHEDNLYQSLKILAKSIYKDDSDDIINGLLNKPILITKDQALKAIDLAIKDYKEIVDLIYSIKSVSHPKDNKHIIDVIEKVRKFKQQNS